MTEIRQRRTDKSSAAPAGAADQIFAADVGALVRRGRARRGITRRQLAADSGISERYLAQIESGQGNPSIIVMKAISLAMDMPLNELLPINGKRHEALNRIGDLLGRLRTAELPSVAQMIEQRILQSAASERGRRIALVGLRGAGKTTLGQMLAKKLGWPFVELNRVVEQEYGANVSMLIEMSGVTTFRRYEQASLEKVIADHDKVVIATAGGIVANPETYALLLRRAHTVWVQAQPQEHMTRVMAQGDFRPMAENRAAMTDLLAILDARKADYAQAEARLDTSGETIEESLSKLLKCVQEWAK